MPAPLPTPRGALTEALSDCFRGRGVARSVEADSHDDAALALWMLYELHHRGFDEVDDALEWDPALLAVRADLEHDLEERWRDRARHLAQPAQDRLADVEDFAELFFDLCAADTGGESLARFVQREAEEEQVLALLRQRSIYHVREQDSAMWALPRLDDETKAHLVAIAADERLDKGRVARHVSYFARAAILRSSHCPDHINKLRRAGRSECAGSEESALPHGYLRW